MNKIKAVARIARAAGALEAHGHKKLSKLIDEVVNWLINSG